MTLTATDIFDTWFFLKRQTPVNKEMIEFRMKTSYADYIERCIKHLESMKGKRLLDGLGELTDAEIKPFVRTKLLDETISLLRYYQKFPIF